MDNKKEVLGWVKEAETDLLIAKVLIDSGKNTFLRRAVFFLEQSLEKGYKAALIKYNKDIEKSLTNFSEIDLKENSEKYKEIIQLYLELVKNHNEVVKDILNKFSSVESLRSLNHNPFEKLKLKELLNSQLIIVSFQYLLINLIREQNNETSNIIKNLSYQIKELSVLKVRLKSQNNLKFIINSLDEYISYRPKNQNEKLLTYLNKLIKNTKKNKVAENIAKQEILIPKFSNQKINMDLMGIAATTLIEVLLILPKLGKYDNVYLFLNYGPLLDSLANLESSSRYPDRDALNKEKISKTLIKKVYTKVSYFINEIKVNDESMV
jgi:HEPN domain-containing protein